MFAVQRHTFVNIFRFKRILTSGQRFFVGELGSNFDLFGYSNFSNSVPSVAYHNHECLGSPCVSVIVKNFGKPGRPDGRLLVSVSLTKIPL